MIDQDAIVLLTTAGKVGEVANIRKNLRQLKAATVPAGIAKLEAQLVNIEKNYLLS
jgi:hypothetical protein